MEIDFLHLTDETLIPLIQDGKQEAFVEIINRHSKRYYSIAYRLLLSRNDAEDVVQQAFLKLWERRATWDQSKGAKFTTWFYKIVVNLCLDQNKKKKPVPLAEDIEIADKQDGQDKLLYKKQKQALLDRFMLELPPRQQLALNLCFYEGLSNQEAAEIVGVRIKALQSLLMRAKTTLKEKLDHHFD